MKEKPLSRGWHIVCMLRVAELSEIVHIPTIRLSDRIRTTSGICARVFGFDDPMVVFQFLIQSQAMIRLE